jgi:hypothetical protein
VCVSAGRWATAVRAVRIAGGPWPSRQPPPIQMPDKLDDEPAGDGLSRSGIPVAVQHPPRARRCEDQRRYHHHQYHRRNTGRSHHRSRSRIWQIGGSVEIERVIDRVWWTDGRGACTYKKEAIDRPADRRRLLRFVWMPALARSHVYVFCVYRGYVCGWECTRRTLRVRADVEVAGPVRLSRWISPYVHQVWREYAGCTLIYIQIWIRIVAGHTCTEPPGLHGISTEDPAGLIHTCYWFSSSLPVIPHGLPCLGNFTFYRSLLCHSTIYSHLLSPLFFCHSWGWISCAILVVVILLLLGLEYRSGDFFFLGFFLVVCIGGSVLPLGYCVVA